MNKLLTILSLALLALVEMPVDAATRTKRTITLKKVPLTVLTAFLLLLVAGCTTDFEPKGYETHEPSDEYLQKNADATEFADLCMTKIFGKTRATNRVVKDFQ